MGGTAMDSAAAANYAAPALASTGGSSGIMSALTSALNFGGKLAPIVSAGTQAYNAIKPAPQQAPRPGNPPGGQAGGMSAGAPTLPAASTPTTTLSPLAALQQYRQFIAGSMAA
jgi:hypothetical protein